MDYYPFGMAMPGRKYTQQNSNYRYSINKQEKSDELNENLTTALFWEYDSRIGRRWNVDPVPNVSISPFACFDNNPIFLSDILGNQAGGPGPKIPNFRYAGIPVFAREFEFPKIHAIDLEYSKTKLGQLHTFTLPGFPGFRFLVMTVEKDPKKQQANRDANKAANPTQVGSRASKTAGHEVPYAATQQGGALAMRRVTDATENSQHGTALMQFYKEFNLNTGDIFIVPLYEPSQKPKDDRKPDIPIAQPNTKSNDKQKPVEEPKVIQMSPRAVETTKKVAVAAAVGYVIWKIVAWGITIGTDGLGAPLLAL